MRVLLVLVAFGASAFAGCIDDGTPADAVDELVEGTALPSLVGAQGCREGGPVSMYANRPDFLPEPWTVDDINDDTGPPPFNSYGNPNTGDPTTGIWHFVMVCDTATVDGETVSPFYMGMVAVKILPPPWDTSGIERQYFVADLSFNDKSLVEKVVGATGAHTNLATEAEITWMNDDAKLVYTQMYDTGHGEFESYMFLREHAYPLESGPTRLWATHMLDDGTYRPTSLDLDTTLTDHTYWVSNQGQRSLIHWDESTGAPEHYGYGGGAILIEGFERSLRLGPQPEGVILDDTWTH